jgi:hypothetical protein
LSSSWTLDAVVLSAAACGEKLEGPAIKEDGDAAVAVCEKSEGDLVDGATVPGNEDADEDDNGNDGAGSWGGRLT